MPTTIPRWIHPFSSDHGSQAPSGQGSTWMGDRLGTPGAVGFWERLQERKKTQKPKNLFLSCDSRINRTHPCKQMCIKGLESSSLVRSMQSWDRSSSFKGCFCLSFEGRTKENCKFNSKHVLKQSTYSSHFHCTLARIMRENKRRETAQNASWVTCRSNFLGFARIER